MIFLTEDGAGSIITCITISCLSTMSPTVEKHLFIEEGCRNDRKESFVTHLLPTPLQDRYFRKTNALPYFKFEDVVINV